MSDGSGSVMSEADFQEIMNRNQTVSSSAIHRAVSDAASGDYASAIETLVTAISLIRQSRVAHDERCKLLVNTLQVI
jgi:cleavage and polyadenylation specificity factor subunit 6/7